jgi:hypothetical protein
MMFVGVLLASAGGCSSAADRASESRPISTSDEWRPNATASEPTVSPTSRPPASQSDPPSAADDAATARAVCGALRSYVNALADVANRAVDGIGGREPEERISLVIVGFGEALATVDTLRTMFSDLDLPPVPERDDLRSELVAGLDDATAELIDEQDRFIGDGDELAMGPAQGIAGTWFNAIEKAMSVSEPEIYRYERTDFKQAFLDEPDCRHVIQQFQITGSS